MAGAAYMKDSHNRLKSYEWTATGIKLLISDLDKKKDLGKYQGDVAIGGHGSQKIIEIKEIIG